MKATRTKMLALRVTPDVRRIVDLLTAKMTETGDHRYSLADVVTEAIQEKAEREGVRLNGKQPVKPRS